MEKWKTFQNKTVRFHFVNSSENVWLGLPRASNSGVGGGGEAWNIHIGDIESGSGAGPTAAANNADNLLKDRKVARRVCVLVCVYIGIL